MDLTNSYPRSVKDKIAGVVMLARATDKAKGKVSGKLGEYNYDCPMDQAVFGFLGIDAEKYLDVVRSAKDDREIEAYAKTFVDKKSPDEVQRWNQDFLSYAPAPGSDGETYFLETRKNIAPDRGDVTAWADLLDLDEKREVPRRTANV